MAVALGTDSIIEDFEGYNGRVSDYNWNYVETKNVLLPFHNHNDLELSTDNSIYFSFTGLSSEVSREKIKCWSV